MFKQVLGIIMVVTSATIISIPDNKICRETSCIEFASTIKQYNESQLSDLLSNFTRKLLKKQNTWKEYECSNLFVCNRNRLVFQCDLSVPDIFPQYAAGAAVATAGIFYFTLRSLTPYAQIILILTGLLLSAGTNDCRNLCGEIHNTDVTAQLVEEELLSRITCPLQYNQ